ncbi:MAG: CCDC90 family protein [Rhodoferax sp.]|nr:CCDC90 family protein [Rhodoferax sp.]
MTSITFDTHKFVRKLQEAGFNEKQAEGLTEAMRAAIDDSELATRRDLREFEPRLDPRFEAIKGDLSLLKWMMGALIAIAVANFSKQFF